MGGGTVRGIHCWFETYCGRAGFIELRLETQVRRVGDETRFRAQVGFQEQSESTRRRGVGGLYRCYLFALRVGGDMR